MNYMKHLCEILFISFLVSFSSCEKEHKTEVYSTPYTYYVEINDEMNLNVPIYVNDKEVYEVEKASILDACIKDNSDSFDVTIKQIDYLDEVLKDGNSLYMYELSILFNVVPTDLVILNDAYLDIVYQSDKTLSMNIGNIVIYPSNEDKLSISSLAGFVSYYSDVPILEGIKIKFNDSELNIKNIEVLTPGVSIDSSNIIMSSDNNGTIKEYINNYQPIKTGTNVNEFTIYQDNYLIIPLCYSKYTTKSTLSIKFTYELNGAIKEYILEPYRFFTSSKEEYQIVMATYEDSGIM